MSDVSVDPPAANKAANQLAPAADLAGDSATDILLMAAAQGEAKWGTEIAPANFKRSYSDALWESYRQVKDLEQQLTSYVAAVRKAISEFETADHNAADAAARQTIEVGRENQQAYEEQQSAPPPNIMGPHGPQAE